MAQNRTHAVMAQRFESSRSLDNFPTPRWAVRALVEHVIGAEHVRGLSCWEPACGQGHTASALAEYFRSVQASDVHDYGFGEVQDFLADGLFTPEPRAVDWIVTNPPFKLCEQFILKALGQARHGVAMLTRTTFLESVGRYERLFLPYPPTIFAPFVERVPMVKDRIDPNASTATAYCWLCWIKPLGIATAVRWIPPCRKQLERAGDYDEPAVVPSQGGGSKSNPRERNNHQDPHGQVFLPLN
jgi:hypothetical protein